MVALALTLHALLKKRECFFFLFVNGILLFFPESARAVDGEVEACARLRVILGSRREVALRVRKVRYPCDNDDEYDDPN